jgi:penicillin-binding protein 2
MVAVIASGGKLYTPYLVSHVGIIGEEPSVVHTPEFVPLDIDPQILATIREAMCEVTTNPSGTANFVFEEWYEFQTNEPIVCGKTGTAQSSDFNPPHAWFASFAPAEDPAIVVVVVVENSCEGSEVAAPIVRRIYEIYYGLPQGEWPTLWQGGCTPLEVDYDY